LVTSVQPKHFRITCRRLLNYPIRKCPAFSTGVKLIDIKACDIYFNYSEVGRDTLYDLGVSNYDIPKLAIIARLAGNPRFDELVSQFEQLDDWGAMQGHREVEWPQLLKSLREEVQPIEL
jgi:hypothetical protein